MSSLNRRASLGRSFPAVSSEEHFGFRGVSSNISQESGAASLELRSRLSSDSKMGELIRKGFAWVVVSVAACGGKVADSGPDAGAPGGQSSPTPTSTNTTPTSTAKPPPGGAGGTEPVNTGGSLAGGGGSVAGSGGSFAGAGGSIGGLGGSIGGAGGGVAGAGGVLATGGAPPTDATYQRLIPYVCMTSCKAPSDCPSALPYAGACNAFFQACTITCENGCPPEMDPVPVNGGCFCYESSELNLTGILTRGACCSNGNCGAPYYIPCCSGLVCRSGRCG
jgi:hypothetical protein